MRQLITICVGLMLVIACKKEGSDPSNCANSPIQLTVIESNCADSTDFSNGLYILNEGTFTFGNASISFYNPQTGIVEHNVFARANSRSLGDVLQSAHVQDNEIYWVVNNSQKIEVTGLQNLCSKRIFAGFGSPRYAFKDPNGNLWVTELFGQGIRVVDQSTGCLIQQFNTGGWTEHIFQRDNEIEVLIKPSLNDSSTQPRLLRYDWTSYEFIGAFSLTGTPVDFALTDAGFYGVGNENSQRGLIYYTDQLAPFNLQTHTLDDSMGLPVAVAKDFQSGALILADGLYRFENDSVYQVYPGGRNFYGMDLDYARQEIYLFDAKDYVSRGMALRLNSAFQILDSFETGIIPSSAIFTN